MAGLARLFGIIVIMEIGGAFEIDNARFAGRQLAAVLVADMEDAHAGAADGTWLPQPLFGRDVGGAIAFRAPVIFEQDGAEPVDHLVLDVDRAGRGSMDKGFQA